MTTTSLAGPMLWSIGLRADQSLLLGTGSVPGNERRSRDTIPGATMRGAFAAAYWFRQPSADQAVFDRLFNTRIRFADAVPDIAQRQRLSWRVCKYLSESGCRAFRLDLAQLGAEQGQPAIAQQLCPCCGGPLTLAKGDLVSSRTLIRSRVKVALDKLETAKDGHLYTEQSLSLPSDKSSLTARLAGDQRALAEAGIEVGAVLRVGGRTTVNGRVEVVSITQLNSQSVSSAGGCYIMELVTPAVFIDNFGIATTGPDERSLDRVFPDGKASVHQAWVRTESVGGWHAMAGRAKSGDVAVRAGSVYMVMSERPPVGNFIPGLLGVRRAEGYGWAAVSVPQAASKEDIP